MTTQAPKKKLVLKSVGQVFNVNDIPQQPQQQQVNALIPQIAPVQQAPVQPVVTIQQEQPQPQVSELKLKKKVKLPNAVNNGENNNAEQSSVAAQQKQVEEKSAPVAQQVEQQRPQEVKVEVVPQPEKQQPGKTIVSYELIAYFLDKDVTFEVEDDERKTFDKRLVTFLNRKYEISTGKESFNRNSNKNNTVKPNGSTYNNNNKNYKNNYNNNTNNGNTFPNQESSFQRGDSKKLTTPNLSKNNSAVTSIKRGEEDKDITQRKMQIKAQSDLFLEKMRSQKLDNFKKQISEIRLDLNILTPTNFEVIRKNLLELAMTDENLCEHVVEGIIEKARTQKTYSVVYADLCKFMLDESKKISKLPSQKDETPERIAEKQKWFKNHLYTNIQETFQGSKDIYNNKMTFAKPKQLEELSTEEEKNQYFSDKKKRELLNVKFIGNLYLNKSMGYQILAICLSELLGRFVQGFCSVTDQQRDNQEVEEAHYEDHLEALIALFEQTGTKLESECKKYPCLETTLVLNQLIAQFEARKLDETETRIEKLSFEDYFNFIDWLRKNKKVSPRIHSLITNLIERKSENWKERLSTQKGPESITTLHQKHEEEMKQNQKELDNYQKNLKQGGNNRGYNKKDNKKQTVYQPANGKYDEKSGIVRAKEFWAYLDAKVKLQEDYSVAHAITDFKQFKEQCEAVTYGEILIKTIYDCNKVHKDSRLEVAKEVASLITGEQFLKAFNERLNKSKDESSDFPLFLEFLSELFAFFFKQNTIQYNSLKIAYKAEYDEDDKEDLNFVYMQFFEETINLLKQTQPFDAATFIKEQVDPVLKDKDARYASWVKDNSN